MRNALVRSASIVSRHCPSDISCSDTDGGGNFQAALEDALLQADAYFQSQGADMRHDYWIVRTAGQRGGFAWVNEISVTIAAVMQGR